MSRPAFLRSANTRPVPLHGRKCTDALLQRCEALRGNTESKGRCSQSAVRDSHSVPGSHGSTLSATSFEDLRRSSAVTSCVDAKQSCHMKPCEGIWVALNCKAVEPAETQRGRVAQGRAVKALWMCWTVGFLDTTACFCVERQLAHVEQALLGPQTKTREVSKNRQLLQALQPTKMQLHVCCISSMAPASKWGPFRIRTLAPWDPIENKLPAGPPARISHMRPGAGLGQP